METGCVQTDRQENRWGLKIEGQVGEWPPVFSVALKQKFPPRERKQPWMRKDCTELKGGLGLVGPELRDLFLEASTATLRSGL